MQAKAQEPTDIAGALKQLDRLAPGAPLLALGQTVFWDEPLKACVAMLAGDRPFLAGIHDTDYFAKLPNARHGEGGFVTVAHNDTTTRDLWSAAAEFSCLFGSETVVRRDLLQAAGLRVRTLLRHRPNLLDTATEAWGWRGVVSLSESLPITAEVPTEEVLPELLKALRWAVEETLKCVSEPDRVLAQERADHLLDEVQAAAKDAEHLGEFYRALLPFMYRFVSSHDVDLSATASTELLRFNRATCSLPRFDLVNLFLDPESRATAEECYNAAVAGTETYGLHRFGTGALPFDLVIPQVGRGTLRVANRAIIVGNTNPLFISLKTPIRSVQDLAAAIEAKFGPNCALIGKAVSLIGMLAREHVFVFHEGASGYVETTRKFHRLLIERQLGLRWNPILRVRHSAWDALEACRTWLHLPEPLQRPFGAEENCAPSFATRWREVGAQQSELLRTLGELQRPPDLIRHLDRQLGGSWSRLSDEYASLHRQLESVETQINNLKSRRRALYGSLRSAKQARVQAERRLGEHFRAELFEKEPTEGALAERERLKAEVERSVAEIAHIEHTIRTLMREQNEQARDREVTQVHDRRREIELEAELKRLRLIRDAVISSKGLARSNHRPSGWWFPVICQDGAWFREAARRAEAYLEPLDQ